jgi:hypothetical protein
MSKPVATFRRLALSLPGAVESAHMGHPDFRLDNRIFATLSAEAKGCGTLMLTPEQQAAFIADLPELFEPVPGGWGRSGATLVHLDAVPEDTLLGALTTALRNAEAKSKRKPPASKARTLR